jgi:hypothetical protein
MKSKTCLVPVLFVVICIFLMSCAAANKEPAAAAIKAAEDAYNTVKAEVVKYFPNEAKGVEDAIKAAKENYEKGNFDAALETAKAIPARVMALASATAARKAELTKSWEEISGGMPAMLDSIKDKIAALSASRKLPKNMDKAKLESARTDYEAVAKMWDEAKAAFSGGSMTDALAKAKTVREKALEVMMTLGMPVPETPPAPPAPQTAPAPQAAPASPAAPAPQAPAPQAPQAPQAAPKG